MKSFKKKLKTDRTNKGKKGSYEAVACLIMTGGIFFGYYSLLRFVILPRFVSAETMQILTKTIRTTRHRYTDLLTEISGVLTLFTCLLCLVAWDYYQRRKGK